MQQSGSPTVLYTTKVEVGGPVYMQHHAERSVLLPRSNDEDRTVAKTETPAPLSRRVGVGRAPAQQKRGEALLHIYNRVHDSIVNTSGSSPPQMQGTGSRVLSSASVELSLNSTAVFGLFASFLLDGSLESGSLASSLFTNNK